MWEDFVAKDVDHRHPHIEVCIWRYFVYPLQEKITRCCQSTRPGRLGVPTIPSSSLSSEDSEDFHCSPPMKFPLQKKKESILSEKLFNLAFHAFHLSKTTSTFHCLLMTSWCGCCSSYISYKKFKHKEYVLWRMIDFTHLTNCHKMNIQNTNYFLTCWVVRDSSCSKWSTCQCRWIFSGDRSGEIRWKNAE